MKGAFSSESTCTATVGGSTSRLPRRWGKHAQRLAAVVTMAAVVAGAGNVLLKRCARGFDMPARPFYSTIAEGRDESADPRLRRAAPSEEEDRDAGVAEASRQFAIELLTPSLKQPDSSRFPADAIRFERLEQLNRVTGQKIEHWLVDGVVDSRNGYGYMARSPWRVVLGRDGTAFFPIIASLDGFAVYHCRSHSDLIREARRAAVQERQKEAAAKTAQELAEKNAVWQAINAAKPADVKAQAALKLALNLLAAGKVEAAYGRLQELIEKFPDTEAAAEARELLNK